MEAIIEDTRDDLERSKEKLADSKKGAKHSNGLHESADDALDAITSNVDKVTTDDVRLEKDLANTKKTLKQVRSSQKSKSLAYLNNSITGLKKEPEDADKGINLFRVSAWGNDTENVKLADENPRLKNDLKTATTHVDKLTAKNARLEKELTDLKSTTDQTWSDDCVAGLREDFRLFRDENSRLKKDLETAMENVEKLADSKSTNDQTRPYEYVADLWDGMEQLQKELADLSAAKDNVWKQLTNANYELSQIQLSQEERDAEIHELTLENSHLKEELSIARENLEGALSSLHPHSIIKRTDPTVSINEGLAKTYASGTNQIVTEAQQDLPHHRFCCHS